MEKKRGIKLAHYCICPKCNIKFNRDEIQAVKVSARRYGHASCYPNIKELVPMEKSPSEDPELAALKNYISEIYGNKANWALINKQIKKFHLENKYSYSGILKSLIYFYEVKHNSVDGSNGGIGIVEYTYDQAYQYYLAIFMAQQNNEDKTLVTKVKEFIIKPPHQRGTKNSLLDWAEDEDGEE